MKSNIFIPETIKVGFQNRDDTYTKKLAYVIYLDHKGVVRKEKSWEGWRDKSIQDLTLPNTPTSGFVLNKKAGGYSTGWNHRQTYVRVYDPRGFEFEISVPNLLYILENTNSIKGKGLEGELVYGWDGKDLILIPVESPDYVEISSFNKVLHEKTYIKAKQLILGATYKTKDNAEWIYMGRFDYYQYGSNKGKKYFFYQESGSYSYFETLKSLGDKLIDVISEDCVENYADLMDKLESDTSYSPYDQSKDKYVAYPFGELVDRISNGGYWGGRVFISQNRDKAYIRKARDSEMFNVVVDEFSGYWNRDKTIFTGTLEAIHNAYNPMFKEKYLANGKYNGKE